MFSVSDEDEMLPALLLDALKRFKSMDGHSCTCKINVLSKRGWPENWNNCYKVNYLKIAADLKKKECILAYYEGAKCAMVFQQAAAQIVLYIPKGIDLADPGLAEQARVLLRMVFEDAAAKKRIRRCESFSVNT